VPERKSSSGTISDFGFWPALARLIGFEAGDPIFSSLNNPLLMSRITRSGPGIQKIKQFQRVEDLRAKLDNHISRFSFRHYLNEDVSKVGFHNRTMRRCGLF